jgi:hypothetical protein
VTPPVIQYTEAAQITLKGQHLRGQDVRVQFGEGLAVPAQVSAGGDVTATLPAGLHPGLNWVQVVRPFPSATTPHLHVMSNRQPFILQPRIQGHGIFARVQDPRERPRVAMATQLGTTPGRGRMHTISLLLQPSLGPYQTAVLWLNELRPPNAPSSPHAYGFYSVLRLHHNARFQTELDDLYLSDDLRQAFRDDWITLSANVSVTTVTRGMQWVIEDVDNQQTYTIRNSEVALVVAFGLAPGPPSDRLVFQVGHIQPGTYLMRVQVDNLVEAESRLTQDRTSGAYNGPLVTVP